MTFEDLDTWKQARSMVSVIYRLTREEPICRDWGICNQIQRAAVSVMSNTAEGFERPTLPDKIHFYHMAKASNAEVRSLLFVIEDNFTQQAEAAKDIRTLTHDTGRLLSGLIASTEKRPN